MMIRSIRVSQWAREKDIKKLVKQLFPGTYNMLVRSLGWRKYQIQWTSGPTYEDMRALANEIEAAVPAKAALTIECQRDEAPTTP